MDSVAILSEQAREIVERERATVLARVADLRRQAEALHVLVDQVDQELAASERLLRQMEEMLGRAPQLALEATDFALRGRRLREIAVQLLRDHKGVGAEIHYTEWFELLRRSGLRVGGKAPIATFLTQIRQAPEVESTRPRSGRYRLKAA